MSWVPDLIASLSPSLADAGLSPDSLWGWVVIAVVLALGIVLMRGLVRMSHHFEITVREGQVAFRGRFPPECRSVVASFFRNDLPSARRIRIIARKNGTAGLRFQIDGSLDTGEKQRIRNFLLVTLSRP